jgi:hypothetical protein
MRKVPAYETAIPELREMMDEIIAETDMYDPETMVNFGEDACSERREIANRILDLQTGNALDFLREPLEEASSFIESFDLEGIQGKLGKLASGTVGIVKRNPLAAAAAAAALVFAGPFSMIGGAALLGAGGMTAAKEGARKVKQKHGPETAEQLEEILREGIANFNPAVRKLEEARAHVPALRQDIRDLAETNMLSLYKSTIYLAAGRELLRRIIETEIPARVAAGEDGEVMLLEESAKNLDRRLRILGQTRTGATQAVPTLATLDQTVLEIDEIVQGLLTGEIDNHRASLAASSRAVDVLRFTRVVSDFRKATETGTANAIKATTMARSLTASNRIDSPERLQAAINDLKLVEDMLKKSLKALPAVQKAQEGLRSQLDTAVGNVVVAQERYVSQVSTGNSPRLAGPGKGVRALKHEG